MVTLGARCLSSKNDLISLSPQVNRFKTFVSNVIFYCKPCSSARYQALVKYIILFTTTENTARLKGTEVWFGSTLFRTLTTDDKIQRSVILERSN